MKLSSQMPGGFSFRGNSEEMNRSENNYLAMLVSGRCHPECPAGSALACPSWTLPVPFLVSQLAPVTGLVSSLSQSGSLGMGVQAPESNTDPVIPPRQLCSWE